MKRAPILSGLFGPGDDPLMRDALKALHRQKQRFSDSASLPEHPRESPRPPS
jgi:hypothetical protein